MDRADRCVSCFCFPVRHIATKHPSPVRFVRPVHYSMKSIHDREIAMLTDIDLKHLRRCVELARKALASGNPPFGSLLVSADGQVLIEDYNQVQSGDATHHPEMTLARWATAHLTPAERAGTTAYTSGEHCAMCSAAHGWVGLGRIVYATSCTQLAAWLAEWKVPRGPVRDLPIQQVLSGAKVDGPAHELAEEVHALHRQFFRPQMGA